MLDDSICTLSAAELGQVAGGYYGGCPPSPWPGLPPVFPPPRPLPIPTPFPPRPRPGPVPYPYWLGLS